MDANTCIECGITFTTYDYLRQHWMEGHSDPLYEYRRNPDQLYPWDVIKPQCHDCRVPLSREDWYGHRCPQSAPNTRGTYNCRACEMCFPTLADRAHHELQDHDNRHYMCDLCLLPFRHYHELIHHTRSCHNGRASDTNCTASHEYDQQQHQQQQPGTYYNSELQDRDVHRHIEQQTLASAERRNDTKHQHGRNKDEVELLQPAPQHDHDEVGGQIRRRAAELRERWINDGVTSQDAEQPTPRYNRDDTVVEQIQSRAAELRDGWTNDGATSQDTRGPLSGDAQFDQRSEVEIQDRPSWKAAQQAQWRVEDPQKQNVQTVSSLDKPYNCRICSKSFARLLNRANHEQKHEQNIQNECLECGKVFTNRFTLKRHAVQHGGLAPPLKRQRMLDPHDHYNITKINTTYSEKFATTNTKYKVIFKDMGEEDSLDQILATLHKVMSSLISDIIQATDPRDIVHLSILNPELDFPISMPFTRRYNLDANTILQEIEKVLQSYQEFILDNSLEIHFTHIAAPQGTGKYKGVNLEKFLEKKKCIIRIQNKDDLCLARSLVVAIARLNKANEPQWGSIRHGGGIQKDLALKLHKDADVQLGPCGIEEVKQFQAYLSDYQISIVSKEHFNAIIYSGPEAEKRIYLYLHDGHFEVVSSMPAFFASKNWCVKCSRPYEKPEEHQCIEVCACCRKFHEETGEESWMQCDDCNRVFKGEICFKLHARLPTSGRSVCQNFHKCKDCGKTVDQRRQRVHKCGNILCKICNEYVEPGHLCYIKTVAEEKVSNDKISEPIGNVDKGDITTDDDAKYIFFDFETTQDHAVHEPNVCVVHKVCGACIHQETDSCNNCGDRQRIFYGDQTREDFCEWLFDGDNTGATCIAHNSKGFDGYFILKYLHDNGVIPYVIFNGAKIMCMTVKKCKIRFIDSINFTPMRLSQLPAAFGITELSKGYFPHYYNTKANQNNVLAHLPDKHYYSPDSMKKEDRVKFDKWYDEHKNDTFDLKAELIKYCVSDVDILRRCCLQFRRQFMDMTSVGAGDPGIDPYKQCITIASACQLVFRTKFLAPKTIAIIPHHGYHPQQNHSIKAMQWIMYYAHTECVHIRHARNGNEHQIGPYSVDGYYEKNGQKIVLEFLGNFWHGNPLCYSRDTINPVNEKTMGELHETTIQRKRYIEERGYRVIEMWESMWDQLVKENNSVREFVNSLEFVKALKPREAFYGGRTEGFVLYREVAQDEKIGYVDFTSLYPYVNKYCKYPVGHPTVITEEIGDLSLYEGLIKCKILAPRSLYLPVLPAKIKDKLMFALCRACAETLQQDTCTHTDDERAFTGTWVTDELKLAVDKGYKILKMYEVWHFAKVEQYDPETKSGGLFTEYIDTFVKMKQEASGFPDWCFTENDKHRYIAEYMEREGIQLDYAKISKNPGLRLIAKIMLNSFWGKYGERSQRTKTLYTPDPAVYFDHLTSSSIEVRSARLVSEEVAELQYQHNDEFVEPGTKSNVIVAAYTTTHARIKLYNLLDSLGKRVLYVDTDSAIYSTGPGQEDPPLGDLLGQLTSEIPSESSHISIFCGAGPKNYAYKLAKPDKHGNTTFCKVRGITLNTKNSLLINFETVSQMVRGLGPQVVNVVNEQKICRDRDNFDIVNKREEKKYRVVFDKRVIKENYSTLPYGY